MAIRNWLLEKRETGRVHQNLDGITLSSGNFLTAQPSACHVFWVPGKV
jgi:hypothetical protein